jgi:hypothetical protein
MTSGAFTAKIQALYEEAGYGRTACSAPPPVFHNDNPQVSPIPLKVCQIDPNILTFNPEV